MYDTLQMSEILIHFQNIVSQMNLLKKQPHNSVITVNSRDYSYFYE